MTSVRFARTLLTVLSIASPTISRAQQQAISVTAQQQLRSDGSAVYTYTVVNHSKSTIKSLNIGYDPKLDIELDVYPLRWVIKPGNPIPRGSSTSPPDWSAEVLMQEEGDNIAIVWRGQQVNHIQPGQTVTGFSITVAKPSGKYLTSHWTTYSNRGETVTGVLNQPAPVSSSPRPTPQNGPTYFALLTGVKLGDGSTVTGSFVFGNPRRSNCGSCLISSAVTIHGAENRKENQNPLLSCASYPRDALKPYASINDLGLVSFYLSDCLDDSFTVGYGVPLPVGPNSIVPGTYPILPGPTIAKYGVSSICPKCYAPIARLIPNSGATITITALPEGR